MTVVLHFWNCLFCDTSFLYLLETVDEIPISTASIRLTQVITSFRVSVGLFNVLYNALGCDLLNESSGYTLSLLGSSFFVAF